MESLYQRDVYGKTLVELGRDNKNIVVLDADLSNSTRTVFFAKEYPERFINLGVAEQNMMATAAGLASAGKTVFVSTFAMFATGRAWDQVRNTVCYNNFDVKIVASHAGISVGEDGASHQALEDIALMRIIPNMRVIVPCDGPQVREAVIAVANTPGPFYVRLGRAKFPTIEGKGDFQIGKMQVLKEGKDIVLIACGLMVKEALDAAEILLKKGIKAKVINIHTLKPLDKEGLIDAVKEFSNIVICEEHSIAGGLACAIDEITSEFTGSVKITRIGIKGLFGQSGKPGELLEKYGLTAQNIVKEAQALLARKFTLKTLATKKSFTEGNFLD